MKKQLAAVALSGVLAVGLTGCDAATLQGLIAQNQGLVQQFLSETGLEFKQDDSGYYKGGEQDFKQSIETLSKNKVTDPAKLNGRWNFFTDIGKPVVRYAQLTVGADGKVSGTVYLFPKMPPGSTPPASPSVVKAFTFDNGTFKDGVLEVTRADWDPGHGETGVYTRLRGVLGYKEDPSKLNLMGVWVDHSNTDDKPVAKHPFHLVPHK